MTTLRPTLSTEELPAWMRPRRRVVDWGLLIVVAFSLLVILPFVAQPGLPRHTDADLFVARAVQIARVMRSGTLYTRWATDFNFGLGSPLFNYLSPLPHYLSGLHQLITDDDPVDSIKVLFCFSVIAAGSGMFLFARQRWTPGVGFVCALVYLFSPPIALSLSYQMGDLASLLSLGLLPWVLWALDGLARQESRRALLIAVGALALWILADTRLVLVGGVVLIVVIVTAQSRRLRLTLWAISIALLLTAFFWLPAVAERGSVVWIPLATDPRGDKLPLTEIFGIPPIPDPGLMNPPAYRGLGLGLGITALLGFLAVLAERRRGQALQRDVLAFALLGGLFALSTLPPFAGAWTSLMGGGWQPLFPYHLLIGGALICFSCVAGQTAHWLDRRLAPGWQPVALGLLCLPTLLTVLPAWALAQWPTQPQGQENAEPETAIHAIASLREGLLLPTSAYRSEDMLSALPFNTLRSHDPKRADYAPNIGISQVERLPLSSRFAANVDQPQKITFDRLAFPGWSINIDGVQHNVEITSQGLIAYTLSEDAREVIIWFGSTPLRSLAWLIGVCGSVVLIWQMRRLGRQPYRAQYSLAMLERPQMIGLWAFAALCALLGVTLRLEAKTLLPRASLNTLMQTPVSFMNAEIELLGAQIETTELRAGKMAEAELYWRAQEPLNADYQLQVQLIREGDYSRGAAKGAASVIEWHPGGIPTSQWLPRRVVRDKVQVPTNDLAAGDYHFAVSLGQCPSQQTLPCDKVSLLRPKLLGETGGESIVLPQVIHITAP